MSSIPYAATRDGQMFALGVAYTAALAQSAFLVPDFSPRAKAPAKPRKPRKPSSRVYLDSLPLSNTPGSTDLQKQESCGQHPGGHTPLAPNAGQPGSLTPSQLRTLEQAEAFGIATPQAEKTLADWRERKHAARLRLMARKGAF